MERDEKKRVSTTNPLLNAAHHGSNHKRKAYEAAAKIFFPPTARTSHSDWNTVYLKPCGTVRTQYANRVTNKIHLRIEIKMSPALYDAIHLREVARRNGVTGKTCSSRC